MSTPETKNFNDLSDHDKTIVVEIHCMGYQTENKKAMRRCFDTGNPKIEFGKQGEKKYVKVIPDDATRMQILINAIL